MRQIFIVLWQILPLFLMALAIILWALQYPRAIFMPFATVAIVLGWAVSWRRFNAD